VVVFFVSVQASPICLPNCLPNCRIEHDLVNLAVNLVTTFAIQVATHLRVVFVFLVQASTSREVVLVAQSVPGDSVSPVQQHEQAHDLTAKMDVSWSE
jgi:hypothetical protein